MMVPRTHILLLLLLTIMEGSCIAQISPLRKLNALALSIKHRQTHRFQFYSTVLLTLKAESFQRICKLCAIEHRTRHYSVWFQKLLNDNVNTNKHDYESNSKPPSFFYPISVFAWTIKVSSHTYTHKTKRKESRKGELGKQSKNPHWTDIRVVCPISASEGEPWRDPEPGLNSSFKPCRPPPAIIQ